MILVTGSTGTVGSEVVKQLVTAGQKPRVLVRSPEKLKALEGQVELFKGDLADSASVTAALQGIDKVFLLTAGLDGPRLEAAFIGQLKGSAVKHVVKLSVIASEYEMISFGKWHRASERLLEASGLPWTFLKPGSFMSNALFWAHDIKSSGVIYQPLGEGKTAIIDPVDIGGVAVKALTTDGHAGKAYTLTGPVALSTQDQADIIGKAIGKSVKHVDVTPEQARDGMLKGGFPAAYADAMLELSAVIKAGQAATVTNTVEELLGRKPGTFEAFVAKHVAAFQ